MGIDTAPNYQSGEAERFVSTLGSTALPQVFGKVGYTGGDPRSLSQLAGGARHCLEAAYVEGRVQLSMETMFPRGGALECLFLHNPEHLWEHHESERAWEICFQALEQIGKYRRAGATKHIGIATWCLSPHSEKGQRLVAMLRQVSDPGAFYYMHPVNILRPELLLEPVTVPGLNLVSSAPFAAGEALKLLGKPFRLFFDGIDDPLVQCLMMAKASGGLPCVGVSGDSQAGQLVSAWKVPHMDPNKLISLLEGRVPVGGVARR